VIANEEELPVSGNRSFSSGWFGMPERHRKRGVPPVWVGFGGECQPTVWGFCGEGRFWDVEDKGRLNL
jgi:hypothetical protein